MSDSNLKKKNIDFLQKAVDDCQNAIRVVDTKAGLILACIALVFPNMGNFVDKLWKLMTMNITFIILLAIFTGIGTIILFALSVLIAFKAINPMSSPIDHIETGGLTTKVPFYLYDIKPKNSYLDLLVERNPSKLNVNINDLSKSYHDASESEIIDSLSLELAKVSYIRERKIFRVNKSILFLKIGIILWTVSLLFFRIQKELGIF